MTREALKNILSLYMYDDADMEHILSCVDKYCAESNSGKPLVSGSAGYVLKWIAGCPYNIDEATVPKSGIDTAPEQVVLNLSLNYKVWLALQEVAKHCH